MDLKRLREAIDTIDDALLELLNKRMEIVKAVGEFKNRNGGAIYRPEREVEIIERLSRQNNGLLTKAGIEAIYLEIFAVARNLELPEKVAYLGPEGSFTHQAAESRFGSMSDYLPMNSIRAVFKSLEAGRAKYGVVPIENSRDGIVGETLDYLGESDVKIVAELTIPIHLSFGSTCEKLTDIKRIYSKDKGFGQCRSFLIEHGLEEVERIPVESTAKAAKMAAKDPGSAAICSHIAAKLYNLPSMFSNIEDVHTNQTRFIILSDFKNQKSQDDKTTILAKLENKPGSLVSFLNQFNDKGINLVKIESRPSMDDDGFSSWFYIDFDGHYDDPAVQAVLTRHAKEIKWLGSYVKGN
jgi:chorismate mutase/prephenate dehydratase